MEETKDNIQRPHKGMVTDCAFEDQPKDSYRYALNAINQTEGETNFLTTEQSNKFVASMPTGTLPVGWIYMQNNIFCVFGTGISDFVGIFDNGDFTLIVDNVDFGFSLDYPITGAYRLRRNEQRMVYWVDAFNKPRYINFDRLYDFYTPEYRTWLITQSGTAPEKWDITSFNLLTSYDKVPTFVKTEIINGGNIPSGSYSAAIQLVDENLNPTEWITVSDPVKIFIDSLDGVYSDIRGSRNSTNPAQNFGNATKSIQWTLSNFDDRFLYYRIAILQANQGDGKIAKALVSGLNSITNPIFIYSGNDSDYTTTPLTDIAVGPIDITSAAHIAQLENRLILAGIKGKQIDWCELQSYASQIFAYASETDIILDDVEIDGNPKNPTSLIIPYVSGEVYSFGIVYTYADGTESPAYHIPGVPTALVGTTGFDYYECPNNKYIPLHSCLAADYWGLDGYGFPLVDTPIRHHKFPDRLSTIVDKTTIDVVVGTQVQARIYVSYNLAGFNPVTNYVFRISYIVDGTYYTYDYTALGSVWIAGAGGLEIVIGNYPLNAVVNFWLAQFVSPLPALPISIWTDVTDYNFPIIVSQEKTYSRGYVVQFSNIIRPNSDVTGYRIVRNKRNEDDKIVVDTAIIGPLMNTPLTTDVFPANTNNYHSFGLLAPNTDVVNISDRGIYIFSPEHQFNNKKINFDSISVVGKYTKSASYIPTTITAPEVANALYLQDVKAGTTFNDTYNTGEDPDGFDLQVLYRDTKFSYATNATAIAIPDNLLYLSACGYKNSSDGKTFFNASADNKILIGTYDVGNELSGLFTVDNSPVLYLATLKKANITAYNNFISRPYYKEHQNIIPFTDSIVMSPVIANGDSYVSPMTINNSTYYDTKLADRAKKNRVWKIIAGAALIVAGILTEVLSFGTATPLVVLAISQGISLIASGISFEVMKKMIDQHYEAGLKVCLEDDDNKDTNYMTSIPDDKFCWFTDRIQNIYFESSINIALRSGLTTPVSDFENSPSITLSTTTSDTYEAYLTSKYTIMDREKNNGRLYTGYPVSEFYDINPDYLRKNYEKSYYCLPLEYECCSTNRETFLNRCHYSEQSYQEEKLDNYRKFLPNNYKDIEGEFGRITNLFRQGQSLFIHTEEALFHLPQNLQERVNQELISFIGTGEFFSIPPRKVPTGYGSQHKAATVVTPFGILYVSQQDKKVCVLGERSDEISKDGNYYWFRENLRLFLVEDLKNTLGLNFSLQDTPSSLNGIGIHSTYDSANRRFLITKIDYKPILPYVLFDPDNVTHEQGEFVYNSSLQRFGIVSIAGDPEIVSFVQIALSNPTYFENKSWTISYSLVSQSWTSFHSYLPAVYLNCPESLFSINRGSPDIYVHGTEKKFLKYYGTFYPYIIEMVSASNPVTERLWNSVSIIAHAKKFVDNTFSKALRNTFFNKLVAYNSKQTSGEQILALKTENANFMSQQVGDSNTTILVENKENKFTINDLRDYYDHDEAMFIADWSDINYQDSYPIDKVPNDAAINVNKDWMQLESFRDKYLVLRLFFSNFAPTENVQFTTSYSIENEQMSIR